MRQDFQVTEFTIANFSQMESKSFKEFHSKFSLPLGFWQRIFEYPWTFTKVDKHATCLDIGGTYPFILFKICQER